MQLKTEENKLIPAIIQDMKTGSVLMLGYMNKEALDLTKQTGRVWFWSRSRQQFWCKGETSGNWLQPVEILLDCDADALLVKVKLMGVGACHTGNYSCFYRQLGDEYDA